MDKFVARENIRHFRDRLETETDPSMRSSLHKLLLQEEDRLGRTSEALDLIEAHIADGKVRVKRQQALIASMERDGRDTALALALLASLNEVLLLFEKSREQISTVLGQSSL